MSSRIRVNSGGSRYSEPKAVFTFDNIGYDKILTPKTEQNIPADFSAVDNNA